MAAPKAAIVIALTGWSLADPLIGAAIGLFILPRTWKLLTEAVHILLEGTPPHVDLELLVRKVRESSGVMAVHDLQVWTITSGLDSMSAHVVIGDAVDGRKVLEAVRAAMKDAFQIVHVTIQIENAAHCAGMNQIHA